MNQSKRPDPPKKPVTIARSYFPDEDIATFLAEAPSILRGRLSMGDWMKRFQSVAAARHQARYAFATSSCTSALEMALLAGGVRPGDEVLVPVQTFIATGMAVHNIGARPVFCDIRGETLCLDPSELERRASERVRAVILVHFGGLITPDVNEIEAIAKGRGWLLIEDAAHAHGSALDGRPAGGIGDVGCFSFYPTKVLTTGEGGMVVTSDDQLAKICTSYQFRGQDLDQPGELFARPYGRNLRLPELSALLGVLQYNRLDEFVERRQAVAAIYHRALASAPSLCGPYRSPRCHNSYWLFPVLLPASVDREVLRERCQKNWGVAIDWSYFPPLHLMPVFKDLYGTAEGQLPVAEDVLGRLVCLPVNPTIDDDDAEAAVRCFLFEYESLRAESGEA